MPQFSQQLIAARKAKAMTQEQLAQVVHISRSRVSRWETGDAIPDLDMIRLLSEVLDFDFLASAEKDDPAQPVEAVAEESQPEPATAEPVPTAEKAHVEIVQNTKPFFRKPWFLAASGGALVLILALVIVLVTGSLTPAPVYEPYTKEWYQQAASPVKNQAHVTITPMENPTKAIRFDDFPDGVGWFYTFYCDEVNGVPFTITKITQTYFNHVGADHHVYTGNELLHIVEGDDVLRQDRPKRMLFTGGFPLQPINSVGLALEGVDAFGHELLFRGYVELSQEIAE